MSRDQEFRRFASATMAPSLRLATLLAGDADRGRELLTAALADVHRRWRRTRSDEARAELLRRRMVRRALSERWFGVGEVTAERTPEAGLAWLAGLSAKHRVVLVLVGVEHLTPTGAARLAGLPEHRVRRLVALAEG